MEYISIDNKEIELKKQNLFFTNAFFGFVWLNFHFSIIFFFWIILWSPLLVWLFLWLWSLVALVLDIPIGEIQKYFKPKTLLITSASLMIIVWLIFLKFIWFYNVLTIETSSDALLGGVALVENVFSRFLNDAFNLVLALVAAALYWIAKETFDITILSYVMSSSSPNEYPEILSMSNTYFGVGSLMWLIVSWIILAFRPDIAALCLIFFIFALLVFVIYYFDNPKELDIKNKLMQLNVTKIQENISNNIAQLKNIETYKQQLNKEQLQEFAAKSKAIFLKPLQLKDAISFPDLMKWTVEAFQDTFSVLFSKPFKIFLIWLFSLIILFWFWDTFIATFQVEFLDKIIQINEDNFIVKNIRWLISWYILLALLIIPVFTTQLFFIRTSKKVGLINLLIVWTLASWVAIFCFGAYSSLWILMCFGLVNSLWYAAVMPLAQATFGEKYNEVYAEKKWLTEIDANASAAPLKITQNLANIIWLMFGWLFIAVLGFNWFFYVFWSILVILWVVSIIYIKKLKEWV